MAIERILRAAQAEVWAMVPERLEQLIEVIAMKAATGHAPEAVDVGAADRRQRAAAQTMGAVAVIPMYGAISQRMGAMSAMSGGVSLEAFAESFREAIASPDVGSVLLRIDSPGGGVFGVAEAYRMIQAGAKQKRVVALMDPMAGSAAYWLACAASEVVVTPSGQGGSIGCYTVHFDRSEEMAQKGVKATVIKAGTHKAEGNPYEPLDPEAYAHTQSIVNSYESAFIADVAKGRGVPQATVRETFGSGRMFDARRLVKLGMADRIATYEEAVAELAGGGARGRGMVATAEHLVVDGLAAIAASDSAMEMLTLTPEPVTARGHAAPEIILAPSLPAVEATEETMSGQDTAAHQPGAGPSAEDLIKAERQRGADIRALAASHSIDRQTADQWVDAGYTIDQARAAALSELQVRSAAAPVVKVHAARDRAEDDPRKGFRSHRDFLVAAIANAGHRDRGMVADERLRPLAVFDKNDTQAGGELAFLLPSAFTPGSIQAAAGSDEQGGYADRFGGFAVPTTTMPGMLSVPFEGDPTAGRTQAVPMASPVVEINARTDKDHTSSVSGGFTVTRRPETVAASSSRMEMEKVTLKATSLFGLAYATEEILTDSPISFAALIASGFNDQFPAHILNEKIRGGGGNEFLGVLNSPAKVTVNKETGQAADTIVASNVIKMAARAWGFGSAIWVANHDTRPQLATLSIPIGTGGVLLYQPAQQERFPDMLWGRPVFYTEYANTVGDEGDLMLVNWSQYLEGLYQPLQSAESVHVRFVNHERTFKFWLRNAGAPWWRTPLTPAKSTATLSPIVTLQAR